MTTITKEEIKAFIEQIESDLANGWEAQIFELKLARIALASLDADQPVPEEIPKGLAGQIVGLLAHNIGDKLLAQKIWNACRAAMLLDNQRDLSQPVDPQVAEYEQIMLQAGNSPVIPDGWISCSERMPVIGELNWRTSFPLLVTCEIGVIPAYYGFVRVNGNKHYGFMESLKYGDDSGNHPQTNEYDLISNVTHWMPLPEPPQQ